MSYTHTWTVRFSDSDMFGIAHYPRMVEALHEVSDRFVESLGWPYWEMTTDHGFGLPIVDLDVTFEAPVEAGETVTIDLVPTVGETSVRFEYEAVCDGEVAFTATEQRVCVDAETGESRPLPDDLRTALMEA